LREEAGKAEFIAKESQVSHLFRGEKGSPAFGPATKLGRL
jgi:hypothetical protein